MNNKIFKKQWRESVQRWRALAISEVNLEGTDAENCGEIIAKAKGGQHVVSL